MIAAKNMQGDAIPGPHFLEVDLGDLFTVEKVIIDWEKAYSNFWTVQVCRSSSNEFFNRFPSFLKLQGKIEDRDAWATLFLSSQAHDLLRSDKHIIQEASSVEVTDSKQARFVRLTIHKPSTRWGSSVWRFQIWGK